MKKQRAWRAFWEHLKTPVGGEIRRHGLVGGTVAALLSFFEAYHFQPVQTKESFLLLAFLLMVVFVVGFGAIVSVEYLIQRKNPIQLDEVGVVDGVWVCGFRDVNGEDRRFNRGSVVRITSSGLGFKVEGRAYRLADLEDSKLLERNGRLGFFEGEGLSKGNTVNFHYEGREEYREGSGVGRYVFTKGFAKESESHLAGEFTGTGLDDRKISSREVRGHKIQSPITEEFDGPMEREALAECLRELNSMPDEVKIALPRAGVVDGFWVDAVYEERGLGWEPVKGSIIKFETVEASGRFTVVGDTYVAEELGSARDPADVQPGYYFEGHGRRMEQGSAEGFYYEYYGGEGRSARGVGYYEFRGTVGELPRFEGSFLSTPPGEPHSIVYGVKIGDNLDLQERRRKLYEHLEVCRVKVPLAIVSANRLQFLPEQASSAVSS